MRRVLFALSLLLSTVVDATTTQVPLPIAVYTQVGIANTAALVTVPQATSYCFSATQPASGTVCHQAAAGEVVPICSMAIGIRVWYKPATIATTAIVTESTDAITHCSGGGGSGGGDASAANQTNGSQVSRIINSDGSDIPKGSGTSTNALRVVLSTNQPAIPVVSSSPLSYYLNASNVITAGGVAQVVQSVPAQIGVRIQNLDPTEVMWVNDSGDGAAGSGYSWKVLPNAFFETSSNLDVYVEAATTGHEYTAVVKMSSPFP